LGILNDVFKYLVTAAPLVIFASVSSSPVSISVLNQSATAAILSATAATASLYTSYVYLSSFPTSDMHRFNLLAFAGWLSQGRNKFFRAGGPNISEKLVPGGTNFRGVQIKRDNTNTHHRQDHLYQPVSEAFLKVPDSTPSQHRHEFLVYSLIHSYYGSNCT